MSRVGSARSLPPKLPPRTLGVGLGDPFGLAIVPEVLFDLLQMFPLSGLLMRHLTSAPSELAHASMLRPDAEHGARDAGHATGTYILRLWSWLYEGTHRGLV